MGILGEKVLDKTALTKDIKISLIFNAKIILDKECNHLKNKRHTFGIDGGDYFMYIVPRLLMIDDKKSDYRVPICLDCLLKEI